MTHLALHRCDVYGEACADCCLARDPYCAWDGKSCSRYSNSQKRSGFKYRRQKCHSLSAPPVCLRAVLRRGGPPLYFHLLICRSRRSRRQDVKYGNPIRQCRGYNSNSEYILLHNSLYYLIIQCFILKEIRCFLYLCARLKQMFAILWAAGNKNTLETVQYGVEGSTTFLECQARSPHMSLKWHLQKENSDRRKEVSKDFISIHVDGWLSLVCESDLCCSRRLDPLRGPRPEDRTRPAHPLAAAVWWRHLPVHVHREKLQTHAGQTPAGGPLQSHGQQRAGGDRQPGPPPPAVQPLDSKRWSIQGPPHHLKPAGNGLDQPVLPGLLAAGRGRPRRRQGQEPEGAERAEEAAQPPASRRGDDSGWDMSDWNHAPQQPATTLPVHSHTLQGSSDSSSETRLIPQINTTVRLYPLGKGMGGGGTTQYLL